ncbi:MAG: tripartite tricarboxylate transporter permease [Armatimonadota bacterium]|nr:tripartite tricarboxylate transporter permease [Armatimonadota bacterium]
MIEGLASGFLVALRPANLFFAVVGVVLGTIVGVLPGIGPPTTVALLLPLTYGVDLTGAIIMLAGIFYGAMYGGSTTSILVNLPGEAASVVTTFDGYQMAKQGRGGAALAIAAVGSFVAGTVGVVGLTFLSPPLAEVALRFGPPEYLGLTLLGLTLVAYLAAGSMLRGLLMAGGALLPMLALGIPATAVSAMFMAALNLKGIRVGPLINHDHPGLLYLIYGLLIVSNIIMYVSALLLIRPAARIFSLPRELLMPIISVVCVVGAYEVGLSMFDVGIMYLVGIVGYVLLRLGFPLAPAVLGAILGPIVDENLRRTLMVYEGRSVLELVGRPLGLLIMVIVVLTLWEGVTRARRAPALRKALAG